ncbi:hypothetical protein CXG81DRAFT_23488 [Caulochytrium protostelioides]|uniref:Uncharacterized protein n=1 Tax=Caulochytrium protostelioides TaxID=1555241 RepID=A0A4P9XFD8_9FUNG|nr:hypothetical protein CXG81DRAFT_23488 [Caulochytrium protostelioides]|eukprot:RKP03931.1 hypothetical protein CXG81DRAFT_23488 [Caulochytrium protostelioides]
MWQRHLKEPLLRLSGVSSKGTALDAHHRFLEVRLVTDEPLWAEFMKPRWACQRLRLYSGKQRVFAKLMNCVAKGAATEMAPMVAEVVVAYGASQFAPGGKSEIAVPTARAYQACAHRFRMILVDEIRTTQVHAETNDFPAKDRKEPWNDMKALDELKAHWPPQSPRHSYKDIKNSDRYVYVYPWVMTDGAADSAALCGDLLDPCKQSFKVARQLKVSPTVAPPSPALKPGEVPAAPPDQNPLKVTNPTLCICTSEAMSNNDIAELADKLSNLPTIIRTKFKSVVVLDPKHARLNDKKDEVLVLSKDDHRSGADVMLKGLGLFWPTDAAEQKGFYDAANNQDLCVAVGQSDDQIDAEEAFKYTAALFLDRFALKDPTLVDLNGRSRSFHESHIGCMLFQLRWAGQRLYGKDWKDLPSPATVYPVTLSQPSKHESYYAHFKIDKMPCPKGKKLKFGIVYESECSKKKEKTKVYFTAFQPDAAKWEPVSTNNAHCEEQESNKKRKKTEFTQKKVDLSPATLKDYREMFRQLTHSTEGTAGPVFDIMIYPEAACKIKD